MIAPYRKAIASFLTGIAAIGALYWPPLADIAKPETIVAVSTFLGSVLVYLLPNAPLPPKRPDLSSLNASAVATLAACALAAVALAGCGVTGDQVKDVIIGKEGSERCQRALAAHAAALELPTSPEREKRIRLYEAVIDINCEAT